MSEDVNRGQGADEQITRLREHQASDIYADQAEALSKRVRQSPILAILVATGLGYIIGRIAR